MEAQIPGSALASLTSKLLPGGDSTPSLLWGHFEESYTIHAIHVFQVALDKDLLSHSPTATNIAWVPGWRETQAS